MDRQATVKQRANKGQTQTERANKNKDSAKQHIITNTIKTRLPNKRIDESRSYKKCLTKQHNINTTHHNAVSPITMKTIVAIMRTTENRKRKTTSKKNTQTRNIVAAKAKIISRRAGKLEYMNRIHG